MRRAALERSGGCRVVLERSGGRLFTERSGGRLFSERKRRNVPTPRSGGMCLPPGAEAVPGMPPGAEAVPGAPPAPQRKRPP